MGERLRSHHPELCISLLFLGQVVPLAPDPHGGTQEGGWGYREMCSQSPPALQDHLARLVLRANIPGKSQNPVCSLSFNSAKHDTAPAMNQALN